MIIIMLKYVYETSSWCVLPQVCDYYDIDHTANVMDELRQIYSIKKRSVSNILMISYETQSMYKLYDVKNRFYFKSIGAIIFSHGSYSLTQCTLQKQMFYCRSYSPFLASSLHSTPLHSIFMRSDINLFRPSVHSTNMSLLCVHIQQFYQQIITPVNLGLMNND